MAPATAPAPPAVPPQAGRVVGSGRGYLDDPRVCFAAERTLLAWVRTGVGIVAVGFVVARFGLFLALLRPGGSASAPGWHGWAGAFLVVVGAAACALAAWQFQRFAATLSPAEIPPRWSLRPALAAGWGCALGGMLLAIALAVDAG